MGSPARSDLTAGSMPRHQPAATLPTPALDGTTGGIGTNGYPYGFGGGDASGTPGASGSQDLQNGTSGATGTTEASTSVATATQEVGLVEVTS